MAGIWRRYLFVRDAAGFVISRKLGGDVQDAGGAEVLQTSEVGRILAVAQVEEREDPGGGMGVDVGQRGTRGGRGEAPGRQPGHQSVLAQFLMFTVELSVTSCKTYDSSVECFLYVLFDKVLSCQLNVSTSAETENA